MKTLIILLLLVVSLACQVSASDGVEFFGGDGSSQEHAIIITGAADEKTGVHSEYVWLTKHYPGWKLSAQSLLQSKGHAYDKMDIDADDGTAHAIFFDITSFFGK